MIQMRDRVAPATESPKASLSYSYRDLFNTQMAARLLDVVVERGNGVISSASHGSTFKKTG